MAVKKFDIAILGGGVSGLATAFYLLQKNQDKKLKIAIIEKSGQPGGLIHTVRHDGFLAEGGPNGFLTAPFTVNPALGQAPTAAIVRLSLQLGLEADLLPSNDTFRVRYIYRNKTLHPVPMSPLALAKSGLLSNTAKLRMLMEPFISRSRYQDESLADLVVRRFGEEVLDYVVDPMVSGIYAGMPEELSAKATFPKLVDLEWRYGSIVRGMFAKIYQKNGERPGTVLYSYRGGMRTLIDRLYQYLREESNGACEFFFDHEITALEQAARRDANDGGRMQQYFGIHCRHAEQSHNLFADRVIVTTSPFMASRFLNTLHPNLASCLEAFLFAGIVSTTLGFKLEDIQRPLDGYGFLVPRKERLRLLGSIWGSSIFAGRAPEGHACITCMVGGIRDHEIVQWPDSRILDHLLAELRHTMGVTGKPIFTSMHRYQRAIPQYPLGHSLRVERLRNFEKLIPGLFFSGNYLDGVSVSHCVERAEKFAAEFATN